MHTQKESTPVSINYDVINLNLREIIGWYQRNIMNSFVREDSAADDKILVPTKICEQLPVLKYLPDTLTAHCGLS